MNKILFMVVCYLSEFELSPPWRSWWNLTIAFKFAIDSTNASEVHIKPDKRVFVLKKTVQSYVALLFSRRSFRPFKSKLHSSTCPIIHFLTYLQELWLYPVHCTWRVHCIPSHMYSRPPARQDSSFEESWYHRTYVYISSLTFVQK
jgi:hypothetical protein